MTPTLPCLQKSKRLILETEAELNVQLVGNRTQLELAKQDPQEQRGHAWEPQKLVFPLFGRGRKASSESLANIRKGLIVHFGK